MKQNLYVTLIQSDIIWEKKQENLDMFNKKISEITSESDIVVIPEMFSTGFTMRPENIAEEMSGNTVNWMNLIAKQFNILLIGSVIIKENNNFFNRMICAFPEGNLEYYDKRHLFRMANEHHHYSSGNEIVIIDYLGWKIRPLVCYDLRFPVWSRRKNDYDVLIYVANWPETRRNQWKTLLAARAIENHSYCVAVNRIGTDGNNFKYSGDSMVYDPRGEVISNIETNKEQIQTIILQSEKLKKYREKFPVSLDADNFDIKI